MVEEHTWTSKKFDGLSSIIQKTNKLQLSLSFYLFSCFFYINSGVRSTKDISIPRKSRELSGRERYILVSQISFWIGSELSCFFLLRTHTTVDVLHITQHLNHTSSFSTCFLVETSFWGSFGFTYAPKPRTTWSMFILSPRNSLFFLWSTCQYI